MIVSVPTVPMPHAMTRINVTHSDFVQALVFGCFC